MLQIYENLYEIIIILNKTFVVESKRIKDNSGVFNLNTDKTKREVIDFKNTIINRLNNSFLNVLDRFNESIYNHIYSNCIEPGLNKYLNEAKIIKSLSEYGEYKMVNSSYKIGETIYNLTETIINNYKLMVKKKFDFKYSEYYEKMKSTYFLKTLFLLTDFNINYYFENGLLYELNSNNNCTHTQCVEYVFKTEEKAELNNIVNIKINNITYIISSFFDYNSSFNFACPMNFTNSGINVLKPICESFKKFLSFENQEQSILINEYIQSYIKSNLDDFLSNVVPNFGNPFFERLIDYNINFKIVDLYQNLRYALARTILYYYILNEVTEVEDLPYDLKNRLYILNNLDLTVQEKQEEIKKLLEKKLSE